MPSQTALPPGTTSIEFQNHSRTSMTIAVRDDVGNCSAARDLLPVIRGASSRSTAIPVGGEVGFLLGYATLSKDLEIASCYASYRFRPRADTIYRLQFDLADGKCSYQFLQLTGLFGRWKPIEAEAEVEAGAEAAKRFRGGCG